MQSLTPSLLSKYQKGQRVTGQVNYLRLGGEVVMIVQVQGKETIYSVITSVGTVEFQESQIL